MPRHNGSRVPMAGALHQPPPPHVDGSPLQPDDRVTFGTPNIRPTPGRVLWFEWRDADGAYVNPSRKPGRDSRNGSWRALVVPDDGTPSRFVAVASLHRERIAR